MSNINTNVEDIIPFSKDEFEILLALSMGMKSNSRSRILNALQKSMKVTLQMRNQPFL